MSQLEQTLLLLIRNAGLPDPEREYRAIPGRRFRFDFAWPDHKLLVECHGGVWVRGRHVTGQGFINDREKCDLAQLNGWRVLEVCRCHIEDGRAIEWVREGMRCSNS